MSKRDASAETLAEVVATSGRREGEFVPDDHPVTCTTRLPFYLCVWPDFETAMNVCDRDLYRWIESIPEGRRSACLVRELQRINEATWQAQYRQWSDCEAGRYAPQTQTEGMRVRVASRLPARASAHGQTVPLTLADRKSAVRLTFSPPAHPNVCPRLPFHFLHSVAEFGINYYPQHTRIAFNPNGDEAFWNGAGPWEGARVMITWSLDGRGRLHDALRFLHLQAQITSDKVFAHWVGFKLAEPPPPASLLERCMPFQANAVSIETPAWDWQSGTDQGWHIVSEYTHVDSGRTWVFDHWFASYSGWNPTGMGGYGADHALIDPVPECDEVLPDTDGTWLHRICVFEFKRKAAPVWIRYQGDLVDRGTSAITPTISTPYVPGVSHGLAICEEVVTIRTVGATKASFRLLDITPVPGFGIRLTLTVINALHFAACILTPSLTGIADRSQYGGAVEHYDLPPVWLVRNLPAYSESDPVSVLVPMNIIAPGDCPVQALHWRLRYCGEAFAAPLNALADGIYGHGNNGDWMPPACRVSHNPDYAAMLLAGYLQNGDKVWNSLWDSSADLTRELAIMPVRKAPGADVGIVHDPRFGGGPTFFDQACFIAFITWRAQYRVSINPEIWETRSGTEVLALTLDDALARYGQILTLTVANGRPMWSPYYRKWVTVFEAWPGGNVEELENFLVTRLRESGPFQPAGHWRDFQYVSLKKPWLTAGVLSWFRNQPPKTHQTYLHAHTLIQTSASAETVEVLIMAY